MLSKYSSAVGGVTRIFMSASQTEMHTLSVVSVLISGKLTDGCMHARPLAVKRSEFVNMDCFNACSSLVSKSAALREPNAKAPGVRFSFHVPSADGRGL